jgi:dihydrofolate reductase
MGKLGVFNFITLNGFYSGPNDDISWHKDNDPEKDDYGKQGVGAATTLIFGRVTYQMMAGFWPSPDAMKHMPEMAEGMNRAEKIVFSRTLQSTDWNNTTLVKDDMFGAIKKLKETGKDCTILGSGSIVTQLAEHGLIDEYQFMIDPIALGSGKQVFNGLNTKLELTLAGHKVFKSGVVILTYKPA